ncbi:MAG: hypothetical protein Q9159_006373 [Coniocarpon cinnabarinum]
MDKDAINTSSNEYSKTGEGDAGAAHTSKAFDPHDTSPESQHGGTQAEAGSANPLEVSPGNHDTARFEGAKGKEGSHAESAGGVGRRGVSGGEGTGGVGTGKK